MTNGSDQLSEFLEDAQAECDLRSRSGVMCLLVNEEGHSVELILDTNVNYYGDCIKGEGADICLYRDMETHKVVGCRLPLYQKELIVHRIEKGECDI